MKKIYFKNSDQHMAVHTLFCIGRNYAAHAAELNNPLPELPVVFLKPLTSITYHQEKIQLPAQSMDVHHEVEMVVLIGKSGKNISPEAALSYVQGYGVGIDVTARDLQSAAKKKAHPWSVAKGFDTFAPISEFVRPDQVADAANVALSLAVNGEIRQQGNSRDMIFSVEKLIAYLSMIFTLTPGDLIFTGTPEGVGKISSGDLLTATLGDNLVHLEVQAV